MGLRSGLALVCLAVSSAVLAASPKTTYLALGDSITWGWIQNQASPSNGDKGFVSKVADWIAGQNGARPVVLNYAIPGEMTTSYFDVSNKSRDYNTNYRLSPLPQAIAMSRAVDAETSAGRTITHVSYILGINDLLKLHNQQFWSLPLAQQKTAVDDALKVCETEIKQALDGIRSKLPNAILLVPNYYNPYRANSDPAFPIMEYGLVKLNTILDQQAKLHHGISVDVYDRYNGQEGQLTNMLTGDIHPNDAGYRATADLMISAIAPRLDSVLLDSASIQSGSSVGATLSLTDYEGTGGSAASLTSASSVIHVPATVSFPAGAKRARFVVSTSPIASQAVRTLEASLRGTTKVATLQLTPTWVVSSLIFSSSMVTGRNSVVATVRLNGPVSPASASGVVVKVLSPSAAIMVPETVTVPAGKSAASFTIQTKPVAQTYSRTVIVSLNGRGVSASLTLTP